VLLLLDFKHMFSESRAVGFLCNQIILVILASEFHIFIYLINVFDRLCGLVVRIPGYRSRGPGLIPSATRFSENGVHSAS
jgi:hypothetical protein